MRLLKLVLAVLLLPACAALTMTAWQATAASLARNRDLKFPSSTGVRGASIATKHDAQPAGAADGRQRLLAFAAGYALWLAVFALLPKPMRTYVLGHELTHALWALLMGARVGGLKVRQSGGQVRTSKINWLIVLAPYFFPFYAIFFIAVFGLAHAIWHLDQYFLVLYFLVGLGWSFHVTFTLMMLLTTRQPDIQTQGVLFSLVVIYGMNLLAMLLTLGLLVPTIGWRNLASIFGADCWQSYAWTLDKCVLLWHRFALYAFRS